MGRVLGTVAMAVGVTLAAAACGGSDDDPPVTLEGVTNDHGTKTAADGLEVEADDVYFGPTFIRATAGQTFSVELRNEGNARHSFTSPALKVDQDLEPGATRTLTIQAPASGTAVFTCRYHEIQGMKGAVFVP